jgi:L-iditol 2-dehydrogenase
MKAAVFHAPLDLRLEDREVPKARGNQIVVKVEVSALCPSDVRIYRNGSSNVKPPVTMGHEFAGYVSEVGADVEGISDGEKVTLPADAYCGKCLMCRKGHENLCEDAISFGYNADGGHADYVLVPQRFVDRGGVFPLAADIDYEEAAMTEPLACSLNTIETLGTSVGKTVAIIGDGPMGLMHVGLAKVYGASQIILAGLVDWKLKLGAEFGATDLVNGREQDAVKAVRDSTNARGADITVVTAVTPETVVQGLKMVSRRGFVSIFGGTPKGVTVQFEPNIVHYNEIFLTGNSAYTYAQYSKASQIIAAHKIMLKKLVSHRLKLEQIFEALKIWDDKEKSMKIVLTR